MAAANDSGGDSIFAAAVKDDDKNVMVAAVISDGNIRRQRRGRTGVRASGGEMVKTITGKGG
jgi:hypothetical protein